MFGWLKQRVGRWAAPPAAKANRGATLSAAVGIGVTGGASPMWNEFNTRKHLTEWVYAAVRATSQRIAGQPIKVGRKASSPSGSKASTNSAASGAAVKELPAHPLSELLDCPNPYMTESTLLALIVSALEVSGQAFLWYDRQPGDEPARLWFLPTGWVREDPDHDGPPLSKFIVRAENSADEIHLDASELIRLSYPDPSNPFRSLSPLQACFRSVVCDEQIIDSQLATFANGGRPGLLVTLGQSAANSAIGDPNERPELTEVQRRVFRQKVIEATSGAAKSGEPVILDQIVKSVEPYTRTALEMDFTASSLITRDRVLASFGVPKTTLGLDNDANRASAAIADETFTYSKCAPICRLISDHLTNFFRVVYSDASLCVWVEAPRPRDPDGKRADFDQLARYGCVSVDELRDAHGLPPLPDGKGAALVRAPAAANTNPQGTPPDRDDRKSATVNNVAVVVHPAADDAPPEPQPDEAASLSAALNEGRLKRFIVDDQTPAPSAN